MKKAILSLLFLICFSGMVFAKTIAKNIEILANGEFSKSELMLVDGKGYLILEDIAEILGVEINLEADKATVDFNNASLEFKEAGHYVLIDTVKVSYPKKPMIVNGKFCISLGFVLSKYFKQSSGYTANWDYDSKILRLKPIASDKQREVPASKKAQKPVSPKPKAAVKPRLGKKDTPLIYIYQDKDSDKNLFFPTGLIGDKGDFDIFEGELVDPKAGLSCVKIVYKPTEGQGRGLAGVYWQHPKYNWGEKKEGIDLTGYTKLVFWIKGEEGEEIIDTFNIGGIEGTYPDSDLIELGPFVLTDKWEQYVFSIADYDLSHIIGGLCIMLEADSNPDGATFYLDEIYFE